VNRRLLDGIATVSDADLVDAMRFAFDRLKLVLEPSGAAALAALLSGRIAAQGRVGAILSGGNVGVERFRQLTVA
jgi:threonine dehydratase